MEGAKILTKRTGKFLHVPAELVREKDKPHPQNMSALISTQGALKSRVE